MTRFNDLNDIEVPQRNVEAGWADTTEFVDKPGYMVVDLFGRFQPFGNDRLTLLAGTDYTALVESGLAHSAGPTGAWGHRGRSCALAVRPAVVEAPAAR